jgi:hypothetical protein
VGARTDAARSKVVSGRARLADEVNRLEASGRAAFDIPARIRRAPAQTLGAAAGAAFLLLGGPQRLFRRLKRMIRGPEAELPKSLLPKEIDRSLRSIGTDGDKVRGTIERDFARYLEEKAQARKERELTGTASILLGLLLKPAATRAGRQLAESLFEPDAKGFADALSRVRARGLGEAAPTETGTAEVEAAAGESMAPVDAAPAAAPSVRRPRRRGRSKGHEPS